MSLRDIRRTNDQRHKTPEGIPPDMPSRAQTELGQQITAIRKVRGYSQESLAREADVGPLDVQVWETGPTSIEPLQKILGILGCHLIVTKTTVTVANGPLPGDWRGCP